MARIIGDVPFEITSTEEMIFTFIREELPDYINAVLFPRFQDKGCDIMLLVPHMGVYLLNVNGAIRIEAIEGSLYLLDRFGHQHRYNLRKNQELKQSARQFFREKFNVDPLIYTIEFFPHLTRNSISTLLEQELIDSDEIMTVEEARDNLEFQQKLWNMKMFQERMITKGRLSHTDEDILDHQDHYTDLSDYIISEIRRNWIGGSIKNRPENPPLLFLSYSNKNQMIAEEFHAELEKRGVYTWKAPIDVPLSEHYKPAELGAIQRCDAFLILLSAASMNSQEVKIEIDEALAQNKKIIPVLIEECNIPDFYQSEVLRTRQYRMLKDGLTPVIEEIVELVNSIKHDDQVN